jgi:predicted DsbA family dithiol-disulfide isomerase
MTNDTRTAALQVDIISDVMCPWCYIGYSQLRQAGEKTGVALDIHWHPFELNPQMPPEGQELREHLAEKYGTTSEQSEANRVRLEAIAEEAGVVIRFREGQRIYNTFALHRLMHWAADSGQDGALKLALMKSYFTDNQAMNDHAAMAAVAGAVGLDQARALEILTGDAYSAEVRQKQQFWASHGISGVPAMVFQQRHLVTGAQGADNYAAILTQLTA